MWQRAAAIAIGVIVWQGFLPVLNAGEEEEPNPRKPTKKVIVEDDVIGGGYTAPDLVRAAAGTKDPMLKRYHASLSVVCDRIVVAGKSLRVVMLPLVWGKDKFPADGFGIAALDEQNHAGEPELLQQKDIRKLIHYEAYVLQETNSLLAETSRDAPPLRERLTAAERALTAALFAHTTAIETNKRRGKSWEPFKAEIVDLLLDVRLQLVRDAVVEKNWPKVNELVSRFAERYRANEKVLQELMGARLNEALELAKSEKLNELEQARDRLADYESRFPQHTNAIAKDVKAALAQRAQKFLAEATDKAATDPTAARNLLRNVESLDPNNPKLRDQQKELRAGYDTLIVGVRRMPRLMSPALAREDSEKLAVELMFEGLMDAMPDEKAGSLYRPVLAATKPLVGSLARELTLCGNVEWSRTTGGAFDAADVSETIRLMKDRRTVPTAEVSDWLATADLFPNEPGRLRVRLAQGHPDPRELLTFKVLPGKYLASKNKTIDDDSGSDSFARSPFGTGPFRLAENFKPAEGDLGTKEVVFIPNRNYWRRPGCIGQPAIKEIRFVDTQTLVDPLSELRGDRLHIYPDIPTNLLERYQNLTKAVIVTPTHNPRIHFLAVNHSSPVLQSVNIRRGLSLAIDRETVLNEVFRGTHKEYHKALAGPYPSGSWQEREKDGSLPKTIFNLDLATVKLKEQDTTLRVGLLYPNDDAQAKEACEKIAKQVAACGRLELALEPVEPVEFRKRVEEQGRFELAYTSFDYPDIWHSHALAALLDPTATGAHGRNYMNYLLKKTNPSKGDDALGRLFQDVRMHRDVEGELKALSREVHERFLEATPFIPLWQIDRHMAVSTNLKPFVDGRTEPMPYAQLEATRFFTQPSRWRMEFGAK